MCSCKSLLFKFLKNSLLLNLREGILGLDIHLLSIEHVIAYRVVKSHASLPAPNDVLGKSIMSVIFTALIFLLVHSVLPFLWSNVCV